MLIDQTPPDRRPPSSPWWPDDADQVVEPEHRRQLRRHHADAAVQHEVAGSREHPDRLVLSGASGFESSRLGKLRTGTSTFWTIGPALLVNVFDAGRRHAVSDQARAAQEEADAVYWQSVLLAFREVEDQLAALCILDDEAAIERRAVDAAQRSLMQATNSYRGGIASYLEVTSAQSAWQRAHRGRYPHTPHERQRAADEGLRPCSYRQSRPVAR